MKFSPNLPLAICIASFIGCSSGSGTSEPATQSTSSPPPVMSKLTITGAVTDDPIDSATVSFRVGERQYEAQLGSDVGGGFSVDIEYDSLDDIVYGEALRNASGIHFVGDVMTVRDLLNRSSDGQVDGTRITNVTTAKFLLAIHSTNDGAIDSYEEFVQAAEGVDPEQLLTVSAAIKAVVESIDGTTLPSGVASTYELADALAAGTSSFIGDLNAASPGTLNTAIDKLLSDGFATEDFVAADVPGVYMSMTSQMAYALFEDGSGLINAFTDSDIERVSEWEVNSDGDLALVYSAGNSKRDVLQRLSVTADMVQLNQRRADDEDVTYDVAGFRRYTFEGRFAAADAAGTYTSDDGAGSDFVLNVGGSGYFIDANGTVAGDLSWQVAGDGRLVLNRGNGLSKTFTRLHGPASGGLDVLSLDIRTSGAVQAMQVLRYTKS